MSNADGIFRAKVAVPGAYEATIIPPGATAPTQKAYKYAVAGMALNPGDFVYVIPISGTYVLLGGAVQGGGGGGGGGGTSNYNDLSNKPSINGNTLRGNKTASELGLGTYSKPSTGIPQTDLAQAVQNKLDKTVALHISVASFSSFPQTISNSAITAGMRVVNCVWGTPSAITGDVTWTTADGSLTLSGSISGSTTAEIDLILF